MATINKDDFYDVLKEPTRENFRILLQNQMGEEDYLDLKKEWPEKEKIAKHILAIANSGGGCIIFGIEQKEDGTFEQNGLSKLKDPSDLRREVKGYLPPALKYMVRDFVYENSEYEALVRKKFQILIIDDNPLELPYICCKDGTILSDGDIYIRKGTESVKANNYDIDKMIQRKMNESKIPRRNTLNLEDHLSQLKTLYSELTYTTNTSEILKGMTSIITSFLGTKVTQKKECYPKEDYDDFIVRMLNKKKKRIDEELDI